MKKISLFIFIITIPVFSQQLLTFDDACKYAIKNNYNIGIERENLKIFEEQATRGNAGYHPDVLLSGSVGQKLANINSEYDFSFVSPDAPNIGPAQNQESEPVTIGGDGVQSSTYKVGVTARYTVFDGFAKGYRYRNLVTQKEIGALILQNKVENTLIEVARIYYEIAKHAAKLKTVQEKIAISQERYNQIETNFEFGFSSNLIKLQAYSYLHQDSIELKNTKLFLNKYKRELLQLIGKADINDFTVEQYFPLANPSNKEILIGSAAKNNVLILLARKRLEHQKVNRSLAKAAFLPILGLTGSYGYYKQENNKNLLISAEGTELYGELSLSIPIFTGMKRRSRLQTTELSIRREELALKNIESEIRTRLLSLYEQYEFYLDRLVTEMENLKLYKAIFTKANDDFDDGLIHSTEVREAQNNLISAKDRVNSLQYDIKLCELVIEQLAGRLTKIYD